jgi:ankyrin repeat protein
VNAATEWTPLMAAASKGYSKIVQLLIGKGADVNFKDEKGRTALWHAANHGHIPVVEMLRQATRKSS